MIIFLTNPLYSTSSRNLILDMDVNKIELNHEEDKSTMTVYSTFTNMEAVLYDADDRGKVSESFSCDTENVCSSDVTTTLSGLETAFKVLAVGVDGQSDVTGAKLVDFEGEKVSLPVLFVMAVIITLKLSLSLYIFFYNAFLSLTSSSL